MDFTPMIAQVWDVLSWFIPPMLLLTQLKSPWAKGHSDEHLVRLFTHRQLDAHTFHRLHHATLNTPDGTTQIDHVFLSPYCIFAQETKKMSGWIFGSEKQAQCTQKLHKRTFKSLKPLRQNYKHLKALDATLGLTPEHLHSVITFVGGSAYKNQVPANVTQGISFIRYIKSFQQQIFAAAEVDAMLKALQTGRPAPTLATHREHVQNLKHRGDPTANRQCPKCGNVLVIRTRKIVADAGQQFWGLLNLPQIPHCTNG